MTAQEYHGNPARAGSVQALMKSLRHKAVVDSQEDPRYHSRPMTYKDMVKIIEWSESVCPVEDVNLPPISPEDCLAIFEHLMFRAFSSTAFTIWAR